MLVGFNSDSYPSTREHADVWPFSPAVLLCVSGPLPSMSLGETHQVFNRSGRMAGPLPSAPRGFVIPGSTCLGCRGQRRAGKWVDEAQARLLRANGARYGLMVKADGPGVRSGAARLANSHSRRRVSRGSITSSTQKVSAVR